jgi:serine/threonine protein kinase/Tol biopolymer transport system component
VTLTTGSRLGPYEILAQIGAGGMGEVYKARDTRLERMVAVKVLPPHMSASPESRQRFEREAKTISQLSHPHICAIYDVGREGETEYLVMELLEGETLSDRLAKGPLPLEQTLRYGMEIADALDKAHRQGIVHRDLKPGNVMLTKSGVKLLDFGLAKVMAPAQPISALTSVPTMAGTPNVTQEGTILGTFQYMAPEQLEGKEADGRTDIFAFGAVLYEMATGKIAFSGASRASLISAIMQNDPPPVSSVRPMTPAALDRVVRTCLAKDPEDRWQSARDVMSQLRWIAEGNSQAGSLPPPPVAPRRKSLERLAWAAALIVAAAAAWMLGLRSRPSNPALIRLSLPAPEKTSFGPGSKLSPDGRSLVFVGTREGKQILWLRLLAGLEARPLAGTDDAVNPFWSPDARFVGFFTANKLKTIEIASGAVRTLCDLSSVEPLSGGTWSPDGVIVFSPDTHSPLYRVSAAGGAPVRLTELVKEQNEGAHLFPEFLPDGRHLVFYVLGGAQDGIVVASLDSREKSLLIPHAWRAAYASPGFLLYLREETLMAQPFDAAASRLSGEPVPIAEKVDWHFSAASNGLLAYRTGASDVRQLRWFDRSGRDLGKVGRPGDYLEPSLSPDGTRVAVGIGTWTPVGDVWLLELSRGSLSRLTSHPTDDITPIWSPDGKEIVFVSNRNGHFDLYRKNAGGTGAEELIFQSNADKFPSDWSRDGKYVLYYTVDPKTKADLWALPMSGEHKPTPFLQTEFNETNALFSPDGRWVAYNSDESGTPETYVRPFPPAAGKWQVSTQGGVQPVWRSDGKELYYLALDGKIMAAEVKPGSDFAVGLPVPLFDSGLRPEGLTESRSSFVVTPDGQRFLVNTNAEEAARVPITVVVHWTAELKK